MTPVSVSRRKTEKPKTDFYDVKLRKKVIEEVIAKTIYNKTYALKGKTRDGRNLTKFVSQEDYHKTEAPERR